MRTIDLALLSPRELQNLVLTEHGALGRVLAIVRQDLPEWHRVRRQIEELVETATDRRPFVAAYIRSADAQLDRERSERNLHQWSRWREAP
ncbi:MAG TPA: hypothetical protein VGV64_07790 [Thermoplasmata archaeon]|nr:hypothetical protein [Thermoplasmata archaeon]HEV2429724.1 hypothetical protein [Thermoplasmata archaeon]